MRNKRMNDKVRQALIKGASFHHIAQRVVLRAKSKYKNWLPAAISQLMAILAIPAVNARILVSEHCVEKTRM